MKLFKKLFHNIESTTSTNKKVQYLSNYFEKAQDQDKLWVIALFTHKRPKRTVTTSYLRKWAAEQANIPLWLFEDSYHIVGDLAETISKVIPEPKKRTDKTLSQWIQFLADLKEGNEEYKKEKIIDAWNGLDFHERFLLNKLITGGFRMGVSQRTIVKALSNNLEIEENIIAHKLMGNWSPFTTSFESLLLEDNIKDNDSKPYPFYLCYALNENVEDLGKEDDWMVEYKWDGIRGQLIKRNDDIYLWSRGEELITHQFPEFQSFKKIKSDFVIDGEILVRIDEKIQNFNVLQKRLGKKSPSAKFVAQSPAVLMGYDILELDGNDLRLESQDKRRRALEKLKIENKVECFCLSKLIPFSNWSEIKEIRKNARDKQAEGLMLKTRIGNYKIGRKKGDWYKWKLDPFTVDVVLLYAQRGHGRRANLFTDFTFAVRHEDKLLPIAKAYSGLTDEEFKEISRFVRANTIERFGPVSSVPAKLVFEIAFEAVYNSPRHKSGVSVRFPRIVRWRKDKTVNEIDTLESVKKLIV